MTARNAFWGPGCTSNESGWRPRTARGASPGGPGTTIASWSSARRVSVAAVSRTAARAKRPAASTWFGTRIVAGSSGDGGGGADGRARRNLSILTSPKRTSFTASRVRRSRLPRPGGRGAPSLYRTSGAHARSSRPAGSINSS